jgi:2-polyprenyl-3-methyl-5-hydroxy-6-metoxy-1,4-benzoquinol methylase
LGTDRQAKTRNELHRDEKEYFAQYYESHPYNPTGWRLRLRRELHSFLQRAGTVRLGRVLSLGCGDGQFELMLAPYADRILGLDLSPEGIAVARRAAQDAGVSNVEFRCCPLEDLEWSETYDAVICLAILHHVPDSDIPALLGRVRDHLKPDGLFYSQDPNVRAFLRKVGRVVMGRSYDSFHTPDERELDPYALREQVIQAGFRDVHIGYIDVTLMPGLFILAKGPPWPMYPMLWADWLWCHSPLARWASGFYLSGRR